MFSAILTSFRGLAIAARIVTSSSLRRMSRTTPRRHARRRYRAVSAGIAQ